MVQNGPTGAGATEPLQERSAMADGVIGDLSLRLGQNLHDQVFKSQELQQIHSGCLRNLPEDLDPTRHGRCKDDPEAQKMQVPKGCQTVHPNPGKRSGGSLIDSEKQQEKNGVKIRTLCTKSSKTPS